MPHHRALKTPAMQSAAKRTQINRLGPVALAWTPNNEDKRPLLRIVLVLDRMM